MVLVKLLVPFFAIQFTKEMLSLSLSLSLPNLIEAIALYALLDVLKDSGLNLTFLSKKIRPPPVKIPYISTVKQNQR